MVNLVRMCFVQHNCKFIKPGFKAQFHDFLLVDPPPDSAPDINHSACDLEARDSFPGWWDCVFHTHYTWLGASSINSSSFQSCFVWLISEIMLESQSIGDVPNHIKTPWEKWVSRSSLHKDSSKHGLFFFFFWETLKSCVLKRFKACNFETQHLRE